MRPCSKWRRVCAGLKFAVCALTVDLSARSKTASGARTIAFSGDVSEAIRALLVRALALESMNPERYLIPAFVTRDRDITIPQWLPGLAHRMA